MKYVPISFKSDYSLLKSLFKIKDIIDYAKKTEANYAGILDENPFAIMDFYDKCTKNDLKCVFGMITKIGDNRIYLYIKNKDGYKNILKINDLLQDSKLSFDDLVKYSQGLKCILPYESYNLYNRLKMTFETYLGYENKSELDRAIQITKKVVFINEIAAPKQADQKLLAILAKMGSFEYKKITDYILEADEFDVVSIENFIEDIDLTFNFDKRYIPAFCPTTKASEDLLYSLSIKGLKKRLSGKVTKKYADRLKFELDVIKKMGYVDYFLIVFDYVKYAKKEGIYTSCRGSAAGSLVSYTLGITDIDPLQYDLLFERFLNPERITMPDIDIDFEDTKRNEVIEYVRKKYGEKRVSLIVAYGTLAARAVLRDVAKVLEVDSKIVDELSKKIEPKKSLKENLKDESLVEFIKEKSLENLYKIAIRLEGLKKHTTIHAAGVVISSLPLLEIVPTFKTSDGILSGYTMEYLERLGLLKMDFLAVRNLTTIHNSVDAIRKKHPDFSLNKITFDDKKTYALLSSGNTDNIFQFETPGMKKFLKKLEPDCFDDLIAAIALFRPGPMDNIDEYIRRRKGETKVTYLHPDLEPILNNTYGIIIYQEQIMQILSLMGGYSFAEADLVRRAMSKKKREIMFEEREKFVNGALQKNYDKKIAEAVYDLIVKFADYGFNKAHSVAYAVIGYDMAYMKANYTDLYHMNTLNMNMGSDVKIKDVIADAKNRGMRITKPDINKSTYEYSIDGNDVLLPLSSIKNISVAQAKIIIENRPYEDLFDFIVKTFGNGINRQTIETLIKAGAMDSFKETKSTLLANIDSAITYKELVDNLGGDLIVKPEIVESNEKDPEISEIDLFGFYVSGHPTKSYDQGGTIRLKNLALYLNRSCEVVVMISKIKEIDTKKGEKMAFLDIEDDSMTIDGVIFPRNNDLIKKLNVGEVYHLKGQVNKRNDELQFVIEGILPLKK